MTETPTPTTTATLLIDTDALINLDAHQDEAQRKRWLHYFMSITISPERNPALRDALELAQADGLRVAYSSRWPEMCSYLVKPWFEQHGYPAGFINWRRTPHLSPAELAAVHAAAAGRRGPVLMIHNDSTVAAELRSRFGIAALTPAQLPATVDGLRRVFSLAREVPKFELPKKQTKKQSKKQEEAA